MKKKNKNKINKIKKWARRPKNICMIIGVILIPLLGDIVIPIFKNDKTTENNNINNIVNENNISINAEDFDTGKSKVKGVQNISNNSDCDSNFDDGKWEKDNWWEKDKQKFTYKVDKSGGPKMIFTGEKSLNNFVSTFEFMPVENIDNEDKEINLVVYIGDLYKVVFEKIYKKDWKNEIESSDSFYVAYIKDDNKAPEYGTGAKIIKLENNISFNKWSTLKIVQESTEGLSEKTVTVEIFYFPDNVKNSPEDHEKHVFNIEDISSSGTLQRDIKIGLQIGEKKSTLITEFNCFNLENR